MFSLTMEEARRYAYAEGQETSRDKIISEVNESYLKVREAAEILGLSERQIYRIKARVQKEGPRGVIHKGKGKKSPRWFTERIRGKIGHLYKTKYRGFNLSHMTEFLNSEEKIRVSRESVRQILLEKGSYLLMSLDLRHTHIFYQGKKLKHKLIAKEKIKEKRAHDYKLLTFLICIDINLNQLLTFKKMPYNILKFSRF